MNKVFKKIRAVFLAVFVALSTVLTTPFAGSIVTSVNAESSSIGSAVFDVIRETTGTDLSDPATWSNWSKVSGAPSYGMGIGNNVNHVVSDPYAGESMDCVRMSMFITGHAIQKAGGNPNDYFSTVGYGFNGYGKFEESTNVNEASTGDILAYGTAHLAVALGWKDGELWTIDGSSGYGGWVIHKYRGYASSGGASANFSKLYKVPPMNKKIGVSVKKNSSLPDCTNGNSLYGLSATFGVYTSADGNEATRIATIQTDANGNGSATGISVSPSVNTVYVKELTAPANYRLSDTSIHGVDVSSGNGSTTFTDEPLNDPAVIELSKVDSEGKENAASLEGAEFTINYYDTLGSIDGRNAYRTWVIKTIYNEVRQQYIAQLDDAHLVSGTLFKTPYGSTYIPLGTITIQETKAPNNYTTDGGYLKANGEQFSANDKMTFQIVNENSMAVIHAGNVFTKKEDAIRGGYRLEKQDWSTGATAEGDASLAGAEFDLYYLGDGTDSNVSIKLDKDGDGLGEGTEYLPSDTTPIDHVTVGEDGTYTSSATYLGYGKYKVVETKSPEGYLLTSYDAALISKEFFVSDDTVTVEVPVANYPFLGSFKIQKNDNELKEAYAQGDSNLQTTFEIINASAHPVTVLNHTYAVGEAIDIEGNGSTTFTTDENGFYQSAEKILPYGTYTINEINPPLGHNSDGTTSYTFSIRNHGEYVDATYKIFNDVVRGGFKIQKNDIDYDTRSQGDTNLQATFEIINKSNADVLVDVNGDGVLDKDSERFAPNAKITDFTTDENGYYETASDFLPYGTYQINETVPPVGYTQDGTITKTFEVRNEDEISDLTYEIFNRVDYGKFSIHKVGAASSSDWADPEKDVEFVAVLSSKIGEGKPYATFEDAYNAIAAAGKTGDIKDADGNIILTVHEYAVVKTDDAGNATSNDLAYGTYTIKQTSHVEDTVDVTNEATFVVKEDGQATVAYTATNSPMKYRIHVVKKDADTGKTVSLNSAEFKIFQLTDRKGNKVNQYVKQKVGLFTYDTFKTNSDNTGLGAVNTFTGTYTDSNDDKGSITTPLELESGTYRLEEVKTPEGYLLLDEPVEFTVKESTITRRDDDGDAIIAVEAVDNKPHGTLEINKQLEDYDYDQSLLRDGFDYSTIKFELRAAEDIIDPADGSTLTAKGDIAKNVYGTEVGSIALNADGTASVTDLPMGKYTLKETAVPAGVVLDSTEREVEFKQEDTDAQHKTYKVVFADDAEITDWKDKSKVQTANDAIVNKVTKVEISKKTVTGDDELEGATLTVKDSNGDVVLDKDGNELTWVSGDHPHKIEGLHINEAYTLEETVAADGYVKASSIDFTVDETGAVTEQTMIDKILTVRKVDMCGSNVEGAQITIYNTDEEENKIEDSIVDQWTTEKGKHHDANNLEVGKTYIASETVVPAGYAKAPDYKFTVADDKKNQTETIYNKQVTISKVDAGGKEVEGAKLTLTDKETGKIVDQWISTNKTHYPTGIEIGKTYILTEDTAPLGYIKSTQVEFTVTDNGIDQKITMVDEITRVAKTDENGNYVKGATLQAVAEDGTVVDEWVSGSHIVDIAEADVTTLEGGETVTYESEDGTVTKIIPVAKVTESDDEDAKVVNGSTDADKEKACEVKTDEDKGDTDQDGSDSEKKEYTYTAQITKTDGTIRYFDVDLNGDETTHRVSNLNGSSSYTIREVKTVDGYYYFEDITTDTTEDGKNQYVTAVDNSINYQIAKVDDNGEYVQGVTLKLTDITDAENPVEVELPNNGVTTEKPFDLNEHQMTAEHTYELVESEYVAGVYKATKMQFTVPKYGTNEVTKVTMEDITTNIAVSKVDNHGDRVKGAKMSVLEAVKNDDGTITPAVDENGTEKAPVYTFTTEDKATDISGYVKGSNEESGDVWYILREDETPFGFEKMVDQPFKVTGTNEEHQVIVGVDTRKQYYVSAIKVDKQNEKKLLKGAELTLYTKDGKVAKEVSGKEAKGLTDGKGNITWCVEYNGDGTKDTLSGYYVRETAAPKGYRLNKDNHDVVLSEDYNFANDNAVKIVVRDTLLPAIRTMDSDGFLLAGAVFAGCLAGIALYFYKKRKHANS